MKISFGSFPGRKQLCKKPLLTIKETCRYLGISLRHLEALERDDPCFPGRKSENMHSRALLDYWLEHTAGQWRDSNCDYRFADKSVRFKISPDQLN